MTPLVIVGCGAKKHVSGRWRAADLYTGGYFKARLAYARTLTPDDHILILSAKFGFVNLDCLLPPYDLRLGDPGAITAVEATLQLQFSHQVMGEPDWLDHPEVVVLAGRDYVDLSRQLWPDLAAPLQGGIGQQLSWLKQATEGATT